MTTLTVNSLTAVARASRFSAEQRPRDRHQRGEQRKRAGDQPAAEQHQHDGEDDERDRLAADRVLGGLLGEAALGQQLAAHEHLRCVDRAQLVGDPVRDGERGVLVEAGVELDHGERAALIGGHQALGRVGVADLVDAREVAQLVHHVRGGLDERGREEVRAADHRHDRLSLGRERVEAFLRPRRVPARRLDGLRAVVHAAAEDGPGERHRRPDAEDHVPPAGSRAPQPSKHREIVEAAQSTMSRSVSGSTWVAGSR